MNVHFRRLTVVTVFGGLALSRSAGIAGEERGFYAGADLGGAERKSEVPGGALVHGINSEAAGLVSCVG